MIQKHTCTNDHKNTPFSIPQNCLWQDDLLCISSYCLYFPSALVERSLVYETEGEREHVNKCISSGFVGRADKISQTNFMSERWPIYFLHSWMSFLFCGFFHQVVKTHKYSVSSGHLSTLFVQSQVRFLAALLAPPVWGEEEVSRPASSAPHTGAVEVSAILFGLSCRLPEESSLLAAGPLHGHTPPPAASPSLPGKLKYSPASLAL